VTCLGGTGRADPASPAQVDRHRGVCYAAWSSPRAWLRPESDAALRQVAELGASWVSLRVTWFQDKFDTPALHPNSATPDDDAIAHAVQTIHALGMRAMLVLVVDLADSTGSEWSPGEKWRGMIQFADEQGWRSWFAAYGEFCARYAAMAQSCGIDMLCIGAELTTAASGHEQSWRDIIAQCRARYRGPLTYQANWSSLSYSIDTAPQLAASGQWQGEYRAVRFWDALDYACVCAYFPLSRTPHPSLSELRESWQPWLQDLRAWAGSVSKPVLFGEIGYHSAEGAAWQPWTHRTAAAASPELQADCYRAFLETFWDEAWVAGTYWWLAHPPEDAGLDDEGKGFPFMGKPAEQALRSYYAGG